MQTVERTFDPEKMKEVRAQRELSQSGLARASGISVNMIREYEQGKSLPSVPRLFKIADTLGCSADDLSTLRVFLGA